MTKTLNIFPFNVGLIFEEQIKARESASNMPAGSEGVVPGVANPYSLMYGGVEPVDTMPDQISVGNEGGGEKTIKEEDTDSYTDLSNAIAGAAGATGTAAATMYTGSMDAHLAERQRLFNAQDQSRAMSNRANTVRGTSGVANPYMMALGGVTPEANQLTEYKTGGLHEQNPLGGIPVGEGDNGRMNTVEEGENSYKIGGKKYVFSNRLIV